MLAEMKARIGEQLEHLSSELNRSMSERLTDEIEEVAAGPSRNVERVYERRIRLLGQLLAGLAYVDPRAWCMPGLKRRGAAPFAKGGSETTSRQRAPCTRSRRR